jgi:hypothetical protein
MVAADEREKHPDRDSDDNAKFYLDSAKLPRHISLDLDEDLLSRLEEMARRSGHSLDELITDLLDRHLNGAP